MGEERLIDLCAPTLACLKVANLFNLFYDKPCQLEDTIKEWNLLLNAKNIYVETLKITPTRAQVYVYRPFLLKQILAKKEVRVLLESFGYEDFSLEACILRLKERMEEDDFPHEIGVFLGYPYEDVVAFIKNHGENFLYSGYWKVYSDEEEKIKIFNKYTMVRKSYRNSFNRGMDLSRLCLNDK